MRRRWTVVNIEGRMKRYWTVINQKTGEVLASIDVESAEVMVKEGLTVQADNYEPVFETEGSTVRFKCHNH